LFPYLDNNILKKFNLFALYFSMGRIEIPYTPPDLSYVVGRAEGKTIR